MSAEGCQVRELDGTGIVGGKVWGDPVAQAPKRVFASLTHACSWTQLGPINGQLMQRCATLLAPRNPWSTGLDRG
ncbi:hypothetical protein LZ30DRAFT_74867 [Colletotrichum cereale]|nr:hypothetical protein LZ30DRAFT_74867 [Colletotrichum cereale]